MCTSLNGNIRPVHSTTIRARKCKEEGLEGSTELYRAGGRRRRCLRDDIHEPGDKEDNQGNHHTKGTRCKEEKKGRKEAKG